MTYSVLALDLATTTGWALYTPGLERPFFDAIRLPGGPNDVGKPVEGLRQFLQAKHDLYKFTDIIFEDQFIPSTINSSTARRLMGIAAMVEWFCEVQKPRIRCYSVELQKWRKHFIGRGGGFRRTADKKRYLPGEDPKELAIRKCEEFGWHTNIADAAEACGVLDYYLHMLAKADRDFVIPWGQRQLFGGMLECHE